MKLYDFQSRLVSEIYDAWNFGHRNVLAISPMGSGKTVIFSHILKEFRGNCLVMAHRRELVAQASLTLALNGVRHNIIGGSSLTKTCIKMHLNHTQLNFYDPGSHVTVCSVNTLVNVPADSPFFKSIGLWVCDEAAHLVRKTVWGKVVERMPRALGLGVTAIPLRLDGYGLGREADGVFDCMLLAPDMRALIDMGKLSDYRVFCPPSDLTLDDVPITPKGEFSMGPLEQALKKSHIVGDVVGHYLAIAKGLRGITFCVSVEASHEMAAEFRKSGVPAEVISAESTDLHRDNVMRAFEHGELLQICNVDLISEGYNCPSCNVVSLARPTWSLSLAKQQMGRALRLDPNDPNKVGIIIDHVGNIHRHNLPDLNPVWCLTRKEKTSRGKNENLVLVRTCPECAAAYAREKGPVCPFCGYESTPTGRTAPAMVDGVLEELDFETMQQMRNKIAEVYSLPVYPWGATPEIKGAINKRHRNRLFTLEQLKHQMLVWHSTQPDHEDLQICQRRFYLKFGIDVGTAQTLSRRDAEKLIERIKNEPI